MNDKESIDTPSVVMIGLRDYFAGVALQGLLASIDYQTDESAQVTLREGQANIAYTAYGYADAMLKWRANEH